MQNPDAFSSQGGVVVRRPDDVEASCSFTDRLCDVIVVDDAVTVGDIAAEQERWNAHVLAGLAVWLVIVAADWMSDDMILIPLLVVVPLVTAIGGSVRQTAIIGIVAVVTAVALGWVDDIAGSRRHWVGIVATVFASGLGLWLASTRAAKERQIAICGA